MASTDLARRLAVAVVGVPAVLALVWIGGWPLGVFSAVIAGLGAVEFYGLARHRGDRPFAVLGILATVGVVLLATARPVPWEVGAPLALVVLSVALLALGGAVWTRWPEGAPLASVGVTLTGVIYLGFTLSFVPLLRDAGTSAPGLSGRGAGKEAAFLLIPLLATWAGDSAAYFAGRAWGRARLAPSVSPGKTVVGAVAGLIGSGCAAAVVAWWAVGGASSMGPTVGAALLVGIVVGAAGQLGDLVESVLKREAGVKDSGTLLPGHGGVLDRVDSLLFAIPITWLLLMAAGVLEGGGV